MMTCSLLQLLFPFSFFPHLNFIFLSSIFHSNVSSLDSCCIIIPWSDHHHHHHYHHHHLHQAAAPLQHCDGWTDYFYITVTFFLIGDSCGNCCFQYSHSVVHAKEVVAKSSIWVCPGSRADEWFSHGILSCVYIYIYMFFFYQSSFKNWILGEELTSTLNCSLHFI